MSCPILKGEVRKLFDHRFMIARFQVCILVLAQQFFMCAGGRLPEPNSIITNLWHSTPNQLARASPTNHSIAPGDFASYIFRRRGIRSLSVLDAVMDHWASMYAAYDPRALYRDIDDVCWQLVKVAMNVLGATGLRGLVDYLVDNVIFDYHTAIPSVIVIQRIRARMSGRQNGRFKFFLRSTAMARFEKEMVCTLPCHIFFLFADIIAWQDFGLPSIARTDALVILFNMGIVAAQQLHWCLKRLLEHRYEIGGLHAIHSIVNQANQRLYAGKNAGYMGCFSKQLFQKYPNASYGQGPKLSLVKVSVLPPCPLMAQ
jgi:hypothetical protein